MSKKDDSYRAGRERGRKESPLSDLFRFVKDSPSYEKGRKDGQNDRLRSKNKKLGG